MLILGIDPGSRKTGYGLIEADKRNSRYVASGFIKLGDQDPLELRLLQLAQDLQSIIEQYQPQCGVIEKVFFAHNAKSALILGHARGVILLQLAIKQLPIYEYSALEVKQAIVGAGKASKEQVQKMVSMLLNLKSSSTNFDESDALAIALTHAHRLPLIHLHDRLS